MSNTTSLPTGAPAFLDSPNEGHGDGVTGHVAGHVPSAKPRVDMGTQNVEFAETQLESYLRDRNSVSPDWRDYFDELQVVDSGLTPESLQAPSADPQLSSPRSYYR